MIAKWFALNLAIIIFIIIWSLAQGFETNFILVGKLLAQIAFILFLINLNMYFVFLLIRKSKVRPVKIKLAQISKRMMKYHIPLALTGATLILVHGWMMISVHLWSGKLATGLIATGTLLFLLFSGLLRRRKATGKRRRFHYQMAFIFFAFVFLHVLI